MHLEATIKWVRHGRRACCLALAGLATGVALAGCYATKADAPPVIQASPVTRDDGVVVAPSSAVAADMRSISLSRVQVDLPRGAPMGQIVRLAFMSACAGSPVVGPLTYESARTDLPAREWQDIFYRVMTGYGYRVDDAPADLFAERKTSQADLLFGANITAVNVNGELQCDFMTARPSGLRGTADITLEWQIFDPVQRRIIHRETAQGHYQADRVLALDPKLLIQLAFADATNRLAADAGVRGIASKGAERGGAPSAMVPRRPLPRLALSQRPIDELGDAIRAATVLIEIGAGSHGSGFLVGENGLVVTNAHVAGGQHFVRVRLLSGRAVVGEVLQVDDRRDVALVKLEGSGYPALPVRETPVRVAEEVYAVGAPRMKELAWTVTRGVVSSYRQSMPPERLDYIQADVPIHGGNSGGPLLDRHGNLVGICVAGFAGGEEKLNASLNLFIPILDGLDRLGLDLAGPAPASAEAPLSPVARQR